MGELIGGNLTQNPTHHLDSRYISLGFAPPKIDTPDNTPTNSITVGVIQNINLSQQRQIQRLFEYGNKEYGLAESKTQNSLQISRILFDGPSILKYMSYAKVNRNLPAIREKFPDHTPYAELFEEEIEEITEEYFDRNMPGYGDFWMNLASDFFEEPIGIFIEVKQPLPSGKRVNYGSIFLENCMVSQLSLNIVSDRRILSESAQIDFGRVIPLERQNNIMEIEQSLEFLRQEPLSRQNAIRRDTPEQPEIEGDIPPPIFA